MGDQELVRVAGDTLLRNNPWAAYEAAASHNDHDLSGRASDILIASDSFQSFHFARNRYTWLEGCAFASMLTKDPLKTYYRVRADPVFLARAREEVLKDPFAAYQYARENHIDGLKEEARNAILVQAADPDAIIKIIGT